MNKIGLILARLKQSYAKATSFGPSLMEGAWHGPSLLDAIDNVDLNQANDRQIEGRHTIWEIVNHCCFWMEAVNRTLQGDEMVNITFDEDWPKVGETVEEWIRDLDMLRKVYDDLVGSVEDLVDSRLKEKVGSYFGERYFEFTYRKMLHGISDHNLYHAGQISIMKKKYN
jgi:uncharacterized damage-inducible protein DinB